jgi:hypothetical protein
MSAMAGHNNEAMTTLTAVIVVTAAGLQQTGSCDGLAGALCTIHPHVYYQPSRIQWCLELECAQDKMQMKGFQNTR